VPFGPQASLRRISLPDWQVDKTRYVSYRAAMIAFAASNFWYFGYDSLLAVGGSRAI
jgi:hypothetical protein